ncbi:NAD(P)-binding domain-containing protein [Micromonospora chersina]|uniref:NAD(P)-binding domain-containing protein n=1 Tax=Micromonospora chersina TaxID=47854 RepID=UPI0033A7F5E1
MTVFLPPPDFLDSPRGRRFAAPPQQYRTDALPDEAAVVIVGGGLAAISVAGTLWHAGVRDFVIVDRAGRLGGQFLRRADILGQRVLRSPYDHHPGVEGYRDCELLDFARLQWSLLTDGERLQVRMAQAGHRSVVPMDVLEAYCDHVVAMHGLAARAWQGEVQQVSPNEDEVLVRTSLGDVRAATVVLCTGEEATPAPDDWWPGDATPTGVGYWCDPAEPAGGETVVVGAGLSGAHLVTNALAAGDRVHWIIREESERYQCADVNASFFRAEGRSRFHGTSWQDRLLMMRQHRRASVMFEFRPRLTAAEEQGRLTVHRGTTVTAVHGRADGGPSVELADGTTVTGERVLLALGTRPLIGSELLPTDVVRARDGWPDLEEVTLAYRSAPRVHALGAAACMALGPAARNIDGHRIGTSRIVPSILRQLDTPARLTEVAHV